MPDDDPIPAVTDRAPPPATTEGPTLGDVLTRLAEMEASTRARFEALAAANERLAIASVQRDTRLEERIAFLASGQTRLDARLGKFEESVPGMERSVGIALKSADDLTRYVHDELREQLESVVSSIVAPLGDRVETVDKKLDAQNVAFDSQKKAFALRDVAKRTERQEESLAVERIETKRAQQAADRDFELKKLTARMPLWIALVAAVPTVFIYASHRDVNAGVQRIEQRIGAVAPSYEPAPAAPLPQPGPAPAPPSMPPALPPWRP